MVNTNYVAQHYIPSSFGEGIILLSDDMALVFPSNTPRTMGSLMTGESTCLMPRKMAVLGGGPRPSCPKEHLGKHLLHVPQLCGRGSALSNCLPAMRRKLPAYKSMELAERKANQGQNAQRLREAETERERLSQRDGGR